MKYFSIMLSKTREIKYFRQHLKTILFFIKTFEYSLYYLKLVLLNNIPFESSLDQITKIIIITISTCHDQVSNIDLWLY